MSADRAARRAAVIVRAASPGEIVLSLASGTPLLAALGYPPGLAALLASQPALRRRFGIAIGRRLGADGPALREAGRDLPRDHRALEEAALRVGLAAALAHRPRVFPRAEIERLSALFGSRVVAFAARERPRSSKPQGGPDLVPERVAASGRVLLAQGLALADHPLARLVAAALGVEDAPDRALDPRWSAIAVAALRQAAAEPPEEAAP